MDVFDSSVWLWGLLTDEPEPVRLVDDVVDGNRRVAVSAYIHDEVIRGFDRVNRAGIDVGTAQMEFNSTIASRDNVLFPGQAEVGRTNAPEIREQPEMRLLGTILQIQAKDAPIVVFAFDIDEETTLYTADENFAFTPSEYNIDRLRFEAVTV